MSRRKRYVDPKFSEFVVSIFSNLTISQKALLNDSELTKVNTDVALKRFVATASMEETDILLTKVGVAVSRVYYVPAKMDFETLHKVYRQYSFKDKAVAMIREMLEQQTFVLHSRDIATSLAMMSLNCHSDYYKPNLQFGKLKNTVNSLTDRLRKRSIGEEMKAATEGFRMVEQILFFSLKLESWMQGRLDLEALDVLILLALNRYALQYVSIKHLVTTISPTYKKVMIERRCSRLVREKGYVDLLPADRRKPAYRITELGILQLGEIMNHLLGEKLA